VQAQELVARLQGDTEVKSGEEWLSTWVQLATERVRQDALARAQTELLGRNRSERCAHSPEDRHGYDDGPLQPAEGGLRVQVPQRRGWEEPPRSQGWAQRAQTRDRLTTLMVELCVGGMSQRDMEAALETSVGQFGLSKSALSTMTETLSQA